MAGLVANNVNAPVTVKPQIRVQDVLTGTPVDRVIVRDDLAYTETEEWKQTRQAAAGTLPENRVLIVIAPRGYGSTSFSLRLLAYHAASNAELIRLEADWGSPKVRKLPLEESRAYQLDLQDPDHDRFNSTFISNLGQHAADLKALGSYLVLNVASELWQAHYGQLPRGVTMRRLDTPPDAERLVELHLQKRDLASVIPYVKTDEAASHIKGRDAVQAMRAVEVVAQEWVDYRKGKSDERTASDHAKVETDSADQQPPPLDEALQQAIEEALGDWEDDLNGLFNERRKLIVLKESMALVRLRRVASNTTDSDVRSQILTVFKEVAMRKQVTARFAEAVASWQKAEPSSQAVKLGLLALLAIESDGTPWIPTHATTIDVAAGLRELVSDPRWSMEAIATIVNWVRSCAQDSDLCASARSLVRSAIRDRHAFSAGMILMRELKEVETPDGGSVGEELYAEIVDPELRSFNPLIRSDI